PLQTQKEMFALLDCERKIGLTLTESLLMSPTKSVTAFVGLGRTMCKTNEEKCQNCIKVDCAFRS
ncbi:MAG: Vitamin B12 dependent methionine synthase activation subunit, partial [Clostridia bacterium]|nr:Vitamin B12 dependent methionine synthase activation subunit [Clostridia bacterium]